MAMPLNVIVKIQIPIKPGVAFGTGYGEGPLLVYGPPGSGIGPVFIHPDDQPSTHQVIIDAMEGKVKAFFPAQLAEDGMLNIITDLGAIEDRGW